MAGIAVSRLGISITDFYDMTPLEFKYAMHDHQEQDVFQYRSMMEGIRFHIINMWVMAGKSLKKNAKIDNSLVPLPWDKETQNTQTVSQMKQFLMQFAKSHNKRQMRKNKAKREKK